MFQLWLVSVLPAWMFGILIVGGVVVLSLAGLKVVTRVVPRSLRQEHNELAGFIIAVIGGVYAVTLALVVVAVWEQRDDARRDAELEASALSSVYRAVAAFGPADRQRLRERIETYARTVVDDEWPKTARGDFSITAESAFDEVWNAYLAVSPQTGRESAVYQQTMGSLTTASDFRRSRLLENRATLPGALWAALVLGCLITTGFSNLFAAKDQRMQSLMNASLAAIIGLGLWLTFQMDAPYSGDLAVTPEGFSRALEMFVRLGH
jgi:hypothetical protein